MNPTTHRRLNTFALVAMFLTIIFLAREASQTHDHNLFECEKRLYEKLSGAVYPFKTREEKKAHEYKGAPDVKTKDTI